MSLTILDGTGQGFLAKVDNQNRVLTKATATPPLEHESDAHGQAAYINSTNAATGGQEVLSIDNQESDLHFHITRLLLNSTIDTLWTLFEITSGTPGGTAVTYQNPNLGSGITRSLTAFGNNSVTGSLSGNTLFHVASLADTTLPVFLEGSLILGNSDKVALTADATGTVAVTVIGFWADD